MKTSGLLREFSNFGDEKKNKAVVVDMNVVVSDLIKIYKPSLKNNIDLKIHILDNPVLVLADLIHIEQVLLNMIINAEKAINSQSDENRQSGFINMTISKVSHSEDPELNINTAYLKIDVEDNGIGMNGETINKIFKPYFTTRGNDGGTGLGLAVSESIVKSYNGIIRVSSEFGTGSCFSLYFPLYIEGVVIG